MKFLLCLLLGIITSSTITSAQQVTADSVSITFEVTVPESTPEDATIYWAGSLNNWDPGDKGAGLGQKEYARPLTHKNGRWSISIKTPKNSEESYKYTRGSIYSAEEQADYTYRPLRTITFDKSKTITDTVEAWHDIPPKSIEQNWPRLKLQEADITIMSDNRTMNVTSTILYDKAIGSQFYDMNETNARVNEIPDNFYDAAYYYQKVSATTNDLQLVSAAKTTPEGPWNIFVDKNGDKIISINEKVFTIKNDEEKYEWSGKIPVQEIKNNNRITDSVTFSIHHASDLPRGYTSSPDSNTPDLTFELPLKNRKATYKGNTFYISTFYFIPFSSYNQVLIDRNHNDTLEVGSGSNEVYSTNFTQMHRTGKYFDYTSFKIGNSSWEIANINPHGKWIQLRPAKDTVQKEKIVTGKPAPDWQATTISGDKISSKELEGNYVLLDFWGSWCGPCIEEIPLLKKVYQQFKDHNFELVGFAYENEASLEKAINKYEIPWPQVLDHKGKYSTSFLIRGYPTHYLIGPNGKILEKGENLGGEQLIPTLKKYFK